MCVVHSQPRLALNFAATTQSPPVMYLPPDIASGVSRMMMWKKTGEPNEDEHRFGLGHTWTCNPSWILLYVSQSLTPLMFNSSICEKQITTVPTFFRWLMINNPIVWILALCQASGKGLLVDSFIYSSQQSCCGLSSLRSVFKPSASLTGPSEAGWPFRLVFKSREGAGVSSIALVLGGGCPSPEGVWPRMRQLFPAEGSYSNAPISQITRETLSTMPVKEEALGKCQLLSLSSSPSLFTTTYPIPAILPARIE